MTGNMIYTGSRCSCGISAEKAADSVKIAAKTAAKRAAKAAEKKQYDFYMLIAAIAVGLTVFMSIGVYAAAQRGFNGGIGGEVIIAAVAVVSVVLCWKKIKKLFKD